MADSQERDVYYELLSADKDYDGQAKYLKQVMEEIAPQAGSLLELGCGTGMHAALFSRMGYKVTGVARTKQMLALAQIAEGAGVELLHEDIRELDLGLEFEVVISLNQVFSYFVRDADFRAGIETASRHLPPGGLFIFDCWHGPGVLANPPKSCHKVNEDDIVKMVRSAEPEHDREARLLSVDIKLDIWNKQAGDYQQVTEAHRIRYLFEQEVSEVLTGAGLEKLALWEFLTHKAPDDQTLHALYISRKLN